MSIFSVFSIFYGCRQKLKFKFIATSQPITPIHLDFILIKCKEGNGYTFVHTKTHNFFCNKANHITNTKIMRLFIFGSGDVKDTNCSIYNL